MPAVLPVTSAVLPLSCRSIATPGCVAPMVSTASNNAVRRIARVMGGDPSLLFREHVVGDGEGEGHVVLVADRVRDVPFAARVFEQDELSRQHATLGTVAGRHFDDAAQAEHD